jgi:hypothetical protein
MQLHANQALFIPQEAREVAVAVLRALERARLAPVPALLAFARAEGFDPEVLQAWIATGVVRKTTIVVDAVQGERLDIVALGPLGARVLTELTGRTAVAIPAARLRASNQKLGHDAGVGSIALALLAAGRDGVIGLAGLECDDKRLASSLVMESAEGPVRVALQPDAYALTRAPRGKNGLLVEYDRGTIAPPKMLLRYAAYARWRAGGGPERVFAVKAMRLLTIVPDEVRLRKLEDAALLANDAKRSGFFLFAEAKHFTAADPARLQAPIVRRLGDDAFTPLF